MINDLVHRRTIVLVLQSCECDR